MKNTVKGLAIAGGLGMVAAATILTMNPQMGRTVKKIGKQGMRMAAKSGLFTILS